jgi:hypothetical protein
VIFAGHVYMLADELWAQTGLGPLDGQLCLDCLEARLGRRVDDRDFMTVRPRAGRSLSGRWHDLG